MQPDTPSLIYNIQYTHIQKREKDDREMERKKEKEESIAEIKG